ncbi:DNA recombination protein RmuC [Candidatus Falkowbacteria bacterium]|nr:DNA recombination protein RmuC [Candidatus Falkowbacteria bacterium]
METLVIILIIILLAGLGVMAYFLSKKSQNNAPGPDHGSLLLIQNQLNELTRTIDSKIGESSKMMHQSVTTQFSESQKLIKEITQELSQVKETGKRVETFADQLQNLQDILKNPKQRGVLGEYYLETVLKNVLPPGSYEMQYQLGKDEGGKDLIPDAVVFVKDKIIPIDSKFSLENYNRIMDEKDPAEKVRLEKIFVSDLKERIAETAQYIQPSKGTMDFAFMFIPHEAIYYDLIINKIGALKEDTESLIQRAASKYKVIIVSPTSFLAYLQTVLQGLKAMQIEEQAKDIVKRVGDLTVHLKKYAEKYDKLGRSLATVVNQYDDGATEFKKIDKDVIRINGEEGSVGYEPLRIEKPKGE